MRCLFWGPFERRRRRWGFVGSRGGASVRGRSWAGPVAAFAMNIAALLQAAEYLERRGFEVREGPPPGRDHGYASSLPAPHRSSLRAHLDLHARLKRPKTKKSQGSRTTHNELEKNRRAHLRTCMEKLKEMVPLGPEASKHTTLGLLTKAKRFIKNLEEREKRHNMHKEQLAREQRFLRRRLEQLELTRDPGAAPRLMRTRDHGASRRLLRNRDYHLQTAPAPPTPSVLLSHTDHLLSRRSLSECSSASASSGTASRCDLPDSEPASISESDEVDVIGYTSNQSDTDDHSSIQSGSGDSGVALSASRLSLAHMEII